MLAIGKDLGLVRQVRAAAVDQVDAWQPVRLGNLLRAQVLLHRHWIIGAALRRGVVAHDHALAARDTADPGDHARAGDFTVILIAGGELADLEEGRARIEQPFDAIAGQQLAARRVPLARLGITAERGFGDLGPELVAQRAVVRKGGAVAFRIGVDLGVERGRGHCKPPSC